MRRMSRRLALSVLGILWIAALLLFLGARRKLEAAGPEGRQTPKPFMDGIIVEFRGGRRKEGRRTHGRSGTRLLFNQMEEVTAIQISTRGGKKMVRNKIVCKEWTLNRSELLRMWQAHDTSGLRVASLTPALMDLQNLEKWLMDYPNIRSVLVIIGVKCLTNIHSLKSLLFCILFFEKMR